MESSKLNILHIFIKIHRFAPAPRLSSLPPLFARFSFSSPTKSSVKRRQTNTFNSLSCTSNSSGWANTVEWNSAQSSSPSRAIRCCAWQTVQQRREPVPRVERLRTWGFWTLEFKNFVKILVKNSFLRLFFFIKFTFKT